MDLEFAMQKIEELATAVAVVRAAVARKSGLEADCSKIQAQIDVKTKELNVASQALSELRAKISAHTSDLALLEASVKKTHETRSSEEARLRQVKYDLAKIENQIAQK